MESKGCSSFSTQMDSTHKHAINKHIGTLRSMVLANEWNSKSLTKPSNAYEFEQYSSPFQKLSGLDSALRENNTRSNETPQNVEEKLENKEGRHSSGHVENYRLFEKSDEHSVGDAANKISSLRRRTLAPLNKSQTILSTYKQTDTPRSKADKTFLNDTLLCDSSKISAADEDSKFSFQNNSNFINSQLASSPWTAKYSQTATIGGDMNFIMLIGLFTGILVSKALQYLQLYLYWFLHQIWQLRNSLLGTTSIWEFLNLDDSSHFNRHTKLMLIPLIVLCSFLYALVSILYFTVRFLLTKAPIGLINFTHKLYN